MNELTEGIGVLGQLRKYQEEIEDLKLELQKTVSQMKRWEACADMLFVYAEEVKCGTHNQALWEAACQDIEKYINLKNGTI